MADPVDIGAVVRRARVSAGLTLADLGRMIGCSGAQVSRMETGAQRGRLFDVATLRRVVDALQIPPERVGLCAWRQPYQVRAASAGPTLGREKGGGWVDRRGVLLATLGIPLAGLRLPEVSGGDPGTELGNALAGRLLHYPRPGEGPTSAAAVTRAVRRLWSGYEKARFAGLARDAPAAIDAAEAHAQQSAGGDDAPAADALLARTYAASASVAIKIGRLDLAWTAADRATLAAGRSGDVLAEAEAARQTAILCRKAGRDGDAIDVAVAAADRLDADGLRTPDQVATYGLLLLAAGYAAAVRGDRQRCDDLVHAAAAAADRLGDLGAWHHGFGPANVAIYRVSCEWALGAPGDAIRHARSLPAGAIPTPERADRFWVDAARAWQRWGKPVPCYRALLRAERAAPQAVRVRPVIHSVTAWLLDAPSSPGLSGLRQFAHRVAAA